MEQLDIGDKITVSVAYKKNLGNYESMNLMAGVTITKREGETDEQVWKRAWKVTEDEVDNANDRAEAIMEGKDTTENK